MSYNTGNALGTRLCEALGIDVNGVATIEIRCEACGGAFVKIERYVDEKEGDKVVKALREFVARIEPR
jgi:hypothetical protein